MNHSEFVERNAERLRYFLRNQAKSLMAKRLGLSKQDADKVWAIARTRMPECYGAAKKSGAPKQKSSSAAKVELESKGNTMTVESKGDRIRTLDGLLSAASVDTDTWRVESHKVNSWETASRGPDGDMAVTPLFQVKAQLVKIVADTQEFPPIQPVQFKVSRPKQAATPTGELRTCLVVPDSQNGYRREYETGHLEPMHDRRCWDLAVQAAQILRPNVVVLLGDMLDLGDWSDRFVTSPDMYYTTQPSVIELAWWIGRLVSVCPPWTRFVYLEGNHEQRMDRALLKHIPAAYGLKASAHDDLPMLSVPKLLGLDDLGVEYIEGYPDCEWWLTDNVKFTHGTVVRGGGGKTSSSVVANSNVTQGFGHIHRLELSSRTRHSRKGMVTNFAFSPGCIARLDGVVPGFKKKNDWQQGLGVVTYLDDDPHHQVDLIPISNGKMFFQGAALEGQSRLSELIEDTGHWFERRR